MAPQIPNAEAINAAAPPASAAKLLLLMFFVLIGAFAFVTAALGPLMPAMRAEMHMSYDLAAFHFSALSLGVIVAGSVGDRLLRAIGRKRSLWSGVAGICVGLSLFSIGCSPVITITGALICGALGSLMGQCVDTVVAESYADDKTTIFTAANVICSVASTIAPLAVGQCLAHSLGWRAPLIVVVGVYLIAYLVFGRVRPPEKRAVRVEETAAPLPGLYWIYWVVILLGCASEWSVADWSAEFLETVGRLPKANAATAVSAFFGAMLAARLAGMLLSRKLKLELFLPSTALVAFIGFLIFWLGNSWPVNVFGLFLTGVGAANMYPLTLSAALSNCDGKTGKAAARMNVATGSAGLLGPLTLGCLAQRLGIYNAYAVVAVLLLSALVIIFVANFLARKQARM